LIASGASAGILTNPTVSTSATPFVGYPASAVFDNDLPEYASNGKGTETFINFDFGSAVTIDSLAFVNRGSQDLDRLSSYNLIFSNNSNFSIPVATHSFTNAATLSGDFRGPLETFTATTARYVRWDVTGITGATSLNPGASEVRFLNSTQGDRITATPYAAALSSDGPYGMTNATNNVVGSGGYSNIEYASLAKGADTYIDFDMGETVPITGFDVLQRLAAADHSTSFDLIFSDDSDFKSEPITTLSYTYTEIGDTDAWTETDQFDAISARYVRYDVTGASGSTNDGISEMTFYTVPEPATMSLLAIGALALLKRRRKK
jgi:hypothetical protein